MRCLVLCLTAALLAMPVRAAQGVEPLPAARSPIAAQAMMLGAAWAGERAVAVGEHGIVLLSERGASARQAQAVPVSLTLTAVHFVDAQQGWAVGHGGVILATRDGGEQWRVQRLADDEDRPLFAVHFFDARHGVAVGLWSLVLVTDDGGATWTKQTLSPPPGASKADLNLMALFADAQGRLYAPGERGMVLRSDDRGRTWRYLSTGYKGSFWSGIALADGGVLVGGQRGSIYRSDDGGASWRASGIDSKSSITAFAAGGIEVVAVGLDGLRALSDDGGRNFKSRTRPDRLTLTAVQHTPDGRWLYWSRNGLAADQAR